MPPSIRHGLVTLLLTVSLAACGGRKAGSDAPPAQAPMAPQPEADSLDEDAAGDDAGPGDLDQLARQFEQAERELAELGLAQVGASEPGGDRLEAEAAPPPPSPPTAGQADASPKRKAVSRRANRCATACRALDSMQRSARGLCRMAGEDDPRCEDVTARAERARVSVARSCPSCASADGKP